MFLFISIKKVAKLIISKYNKNYFSLKIFWRIKILGKCPHKLKPPNPSNAQILNLPNSPNISSLFCQYPNGDYIVEEVNNYKIVVRKPNSKKVKGKLQNCPNQSDFTIWVFEPNNNYWMPKHLETLKAFYQLNSNVRNIVFNAIKDVIIGFKEPQEAWINNKCQNIYLKGYSLLLVLSYLKWMAVLEDTLYPPNNYLGRKMAFAGYILINSGLYNPDEIQRLLKIW